VPEYRQYVNFRLLRVWMSDQERDDNIEHVMREVAHKCGIEK
jgi:hypothetical protein